jgi:hypothetical protein
MAEVAQVIGVIVLRSTEQCGAPALGIQSLAFSSLQAKHATTGTQAHLFGCFDTWLGACSLQGCKRDRQACQPVVADLLADGTWMCEWDCAAVFGLGFLTFKKLNTPKVD